MNRFTDIAAASITVLFGLLLMTALIVTMLSIMALPVLIALRLLHLL